MQVFRIVARTSPIFMFILLGCDSGGGTKKSLLDAEEFARSYDQSPSKYKGQILTIKGRIASGFTLVDEQGKPLPRKSISLEGTLTCEVNCALQKADQEKARNLKAGDVVTVRGTCGGLKSGSILMEKCVIVDK